MNFLRNASIGQRLGLGFGVIVAMIVILAGVAWTMLNSTRHAVEQVVDDRYPKVKLLDDMHGSIQQQIRNLRGASTAALLGDAKTMGETLDKTAKYVADNNEDMAKLKGLIKSPKGEEYFKAMEEARARYTAVRDDAMKLLRDGKSQEGATAVMNNVRQEVLAFEAALEKMGEFQEDLMTKSGAEAKDEVARVIQVTLGVTAAVLVLSVLGAWAITRSITRPIGQAVQVALAVAAGDLGVRVEATSKDETGQLLAALKEMTENLSRIVGNVRSGSDSVATASAQIAQGNADLSQRTEEQASALEETAATMEQLGSTVRNNADSARQANQLAQAAAGVATQGGEVVGQVVGTMQGISESSRKIGDIIGVIDGIAFQTNILALNAAVEAARAGEQGRGFAVVAGEVRTLAQRSAEAAKEIKTLITRNVEQVEQGTSLVGRAGKTMDEIVGSIKRVSDIVAEISSATTEQSNGIQQVGDAVGQMDQVTQQNAALVEESAAAAESLKTQAQQLVQAVAFFKTSGVDSFGGSSAPAPQTRPAVVHKPRSQGSAFARLGAAHHVAKPKTTASTGSHGETPAPAATSKAEAEEWATF